MMDVYTSHINQYQHNKRFLSFGITNSEKDSFHDWEITVNFYAAIHLIEAIMFSECNIIEVATHEERENLMKENREVFSSVLREYFKLKSLAKTARYSGYIYVQPEDSYTAQSCLGDIEFGLRKYIRQN